MTSEVHVGRPRKEGCGNRSVGSKPHVPSHIRTGRILFARCRGQPFHIARILMVDTIRLRCYMRFEDGTTHWCRFCNIQRFNCNETTCCLCHENVAASQVVFCAQCKLGFHPECHNPLITAEELHCNSWACRVCSFSDTVVIDGLGKRLDVAASSSFRQTSSVQAKQRDNLDWDEKHQTNKQNVYCYCRKPGWWSNCMLQCLKCLQWFHYACILSLKTKPLAGDMLFVFVCSHCMMSGQEYTRRIQLKWLHIVQLALYRLQRDRNEMDKRKEGAKRVHFDLARDIMPWINNNWKQLLPGRLNNHLKDKRETRVAAVLKNHPKRFLKCGNQKKNGSFLWSLKKDRPLVPPKIWLPDNGTLLTARFLDQATTEMGIKCVKQRKADDIKQKSLPDDPVGSSRRYNSSHLFAEKNAGSDTNSSLHSTEISGNRTRSSKNLSCSSTNRNLPKAGFHRTDLHSAATSFENHSSDSLQTVAGSNCASSRNATSIVDRNLALGRGRTNNTSNAVCKSRLAGTFKSNPKLRKNHLLNGKAVSTQLSQLRKGQPSLAKLPAQFLLGNGTPESNKAPSFDELFRTNDIAKSLKHPRNVVDKEAIDELSNAEVSLSHLQSSVGQYFGAASRLARGERFRIMGKRVTSTGKLQYLVEWEGGVC